MARKMLVSDYDGTLKSDIKNLLVNIEAVKEFRRKGNIFTISTGRSYDSIKSECDRYKIEYDFINCLDGSVLYDKNGNLIYANTIHRQDLIALAITMPGKDVVSSADYYDTHGITNFNKYDISSEDVENIVLIHLKLKLFKSLKEYISGFSASYPDIKFEKYYNNYLVKNDFDKSKGLQKLETYLKNEIDHENIITVGDNSNDLEMLRDYNGYKMLTSYPCMYNKGLKTTREVHTLIKKINR